MNNNLAALLKELRMIGRMTKAEAAEKFGVTEQTIYNWETGARAPRDLDNLFEKYRRASPLLGGWLELGHFEEPSAKQARRDFAKWAKSVMPA